MTKKELNELYSTTPTPKYKHGDIVLYDLTPMRVETVEFKKHHLSRNNVLVYTTTNLVTNRERGDWTEDNFVGPINVPAIRIVPLMKHAQNLRSLNFDLKVINRNIVDNRPENKATAQQRFNQKRDEYK